ncbi:MAG: cupin domain-containing protein [Opitutaceae bacterium]|jgi:quercetin dioxygenase-like cupin family protein
MNRRDFLKFPLAAAALTMAAGAAETKADGPDRSGKGLRVGAGRDRYEEELQIMGGRFDLKVSGRDTGGDLCIYDTIRDAKGGPALHLHHFQDEWFYIIRGEFIVRVGGDTMRLRPGDSAFAPRRVPHAFAMTSDGEGQMLVLFQPAGSMEDFFRQMGKLGKDIPANQEASQKELFEQHGMEMVGPPLKF